MYLWCWGIVSSLQKSLLKLVKFTFWLSEGKPNDGRKERKPALSQRFGLATGFNGTGGQRAKVSCGRSIALWYNEKGCSLEALELIELINNYRISLNLHRVSASCALCAVDEIKVSHSSHRKSKQEKTQSPSHYIFKSLDYLTNIANKQRLLFIIRWTSSPLDLPPATIGLTVISTTIPSACEEKTNTSFAIVKENNKLTHLFIN